MIYRIEKSGDWQTDAYEIGKYDVMEVTEFEISAEYAMVKRVKVHFKNGNTVDLPYYGLNIYRGQQ